MSVMTKLDTATAAVDEAPSAGGAQPPASLLDLLDAGRFAEYHIQKARMALAENDFATAKYQVAASLCHGRTPEAVALKSEIKRLSKAR